MQKHWAAIRPRSDSHSACADSVDCGGRKIPRYFWYMLSGGICDVAQYGIDLLIASWLTEHLEGYGGNVYRDTISWTIAYTLTIALRHETHRIFVFGSYEGSYWVNLGKMYMTYATTITASIVLRSVLSTVAEYLPGVILEYASPRTCGYFGTQIGTGIFSYFALKKSWGRKASPLVSPGFSHRRLLDAIAFNYEMHLIAK